MRPASMVHTVAIPDSELVLFSSIPLTASSETELLRSVARRPAVWGHTVSPQAASGAVGLERGNLTKLDAHHRIPRYAEYPCH